MSDVRDFVQFDVLKFLFKFGLESSSMYAFELNTIQNNRIYSFFYVYAVREGDLMH